MSYSHIFGLEFSKAHVTFKISTLKFVKFQNFAKEKNYLNLSKKMPYFGNFGPEFWKAILLFAISASCQLTKFRKKAKLPKVKNKNALFSYFWLRISKNYCHI